MSRRSWLLPALKCLAAILLLAGCGTRVGIPDQATHSGASNLQLEDPTAWPALTSLPPDSPAPAEPTTAVMAEAGAPAPTETGRWIPTATAKATNSATPSATKTATPTATSTVTPTATSTVTPSATNTATPSATPAPLLPPQVVGVSIPRWSGTDVVDSGVDVGAVWARSGAFKWDEIEPVRTEPPTYHWEAVNETLLSTLSDRGLRTIAIVQFAPEWAQRVPGCFCGPVAEEALDAFAQFMTAAVSRYSAPPYNIQYWELGNEPDVDPALVQARSGFGCWGDENLPYYGGGYYAEMLKRVYPAIKAADPRAQVLIGGLLLDCDPTHPPEGKDCKPALFLEGILRNGGGSVFDIVSFHGYALYNGSLELDRSFPGWEHRGGVVLGKVDFLREVMASYGVSKPIMHTEGALLCPELAVDHCDPPTDAFYEAQADYVVWLFVRDWAAGLQVAIWSSIKGPGWRHSGLLDGEQQPKPVYYSLRALSEQLTGATYTRPVTQFPDLEGHEFAFANKRIWILWSPDGEAHAISLPAETLAVFDKYGNSISPDPDSTTINSPVYLELTP